MFPPTSSPSSGVGSLGSFAGMSTNEDTGGLCKVVGGSTGSNLSRTAISGSSAVGLAQSTTPTVLSPLLKDWFPSIFDGFPEPVAEAFARQLGEQGFLTVGDLQAAVALDQLTLEYLQSFGFRLGHYNRLLAGLTQVSSGR